MKINVFEGGRRISRLLQIVWVIGCIVVFWTQTPSVSLIFETDGPSAPFVETDKCHAGGAEQYHGAYSLAYNEEVYVTLCFKARPFSNGSMLVPYKQDGGQWWGGEPYSTEVINYKRYRSEQFTLSGEARQNALKEWGNQRRSQFWKYLEAAFTGWLAIVVVSAVLGWLARGFLSIPKGRDTSP